MDTTLRKIGAIWSERCLEDDGREQKRTNWVDSPTVQGHLAALICGQPCPDVPQAIARLMREKNGGKSLKCGLSVGCGTGIKEMALLTEGAVGHFDLYEVSEASIDKGRILARDAGLAERVDFRLGDAFADIKGESLYDLVYWNHALHHMFDVEEAVRWSKKILKPGGMFFIYEYVGPNRFQWTEAQMELSRSILEGLDDAFFLIPGTEYMWKKEVKRSTVEEMLAADPSEAPDSERILDAVARHFENAEVIPLGGLIYVLCLDGILVNIPEESAILKRFLRMDSLFSGKGHNLYAVACGFKEE